MLNVKILSIEGCADASSTIELIQKTADKQRIPINLSHVVIASPDEAKTNKLIGSPTVLINGLDIEPDMRSSTRFGFT